MNIIDLDSHRKAINGIKECLLEALSLKTGKGKVSAIRPELPPEWNDVLELALLAPSLLEVLDSCKDGLKKYVLPADDDLDSAGISENEQLVYEQVRREVAFAEHLLSTARNRKKNRP